MRRIDLAERLRLTPSGVTRLLDGLEQAGLTDRGGCPTDARVTYAVITDTGREMLRRAACTHAAACDELIGSHLSPAELDGSPLLGRLPGVDASTRAPARAADGARPDPGYGEAVSRAASSCDSAAARGRAAAHARRGAPGRPARARMRFIAACRGNRSTAARSSASPAAPAASARGRRRPPAPGKPTRARTPRRPRRLRCPGG